MRADVNAVEDFRAGAKPRPIAHTDAGRRAPLFEHRAGSIAEIVIAADQITIRGDQDIAADSHATCGEDLAVEADVGPLVELDVAVLARQNGVPADEDAARHADAGVRFT